MPGLTGCWRAGLFLRPGFHVHVLTFSLESESKSGGLHIHPVFLIFFWKYKQINEVYERIDESRMNIWDILVCKLGWHALYIKMQMWGCCNIPPAAHCGRITTPCFHWVIIVENIQNIFYSKLFKWMLHNTVNILNYILIIKQINPGSLQYFFFKTGQLAADMNYSRFFLIRERREL